MRDTLLDVTWTVLTWAVWMGLAWVVVAGAMQIVWLPAARLLP